ncbi:hypothetical protein SXCC_00622 [Gluconacetobacter sp. SXCC-1]|nr:hypothetical protein SXCC_00622 [Gluconacetobacter sp. SXCC-1]
MKLHAGGADERKHQVGSHAARRADRPEQPGILVALVSRLTWSRTAPGPLMDDAVPLADAGLVLT